MIEEKMLRCKCGLIVAESKFKYHLEHEHLMKIMGDWMDYIVKEGNRK